MSRRLALLSVTDKTGLVDFARGLAALGFELLSTGGTAVALRAAGVAVGAVSDHTGFPEILGGRVKTLHPVVHGGILAPRDGEGMAVLARHGIEPIDVVAVNLYRFGAAAARAGASEADVVEAIDIGGPCLIRAAAKNHAHVTAVVDPRDYGRVLDALGAADAAALRELRRMLAAKAFAHTAAYDAVVAGWFGARVPAPEPFGAELALAGHKIQDLRYGENPHQRAALYARHDAAGPSLARARQLAGKELSHNNLVDLDAALGAVFEFDAPACAIVKHANPCGAAAAASPAAAFAAGLASDPQSAFGGIAAFNRELDAPLARAIAATDLFLEAIAAPAVAAAAVDILAAARGGKGLRLVALDGVPSPAAFELRTVSGGFLVQTPDAPTREPLRLAIMTKRAPTDAERAALEFAWRVAKHVKSNAIVLATIAGDGARATVGIGAGPMSRVDSVRIAAEKAGQRARGAVLASDAFFPFADGVEAAVAAGVTAVIQPGGSKRDAEAIATADRAGVAMVFTGMRHFRH